MKNKSKIENVILIGLAGIWAFICLGPIWLMVSMAFSSKADNLMRTVFPTSLGAGIENFEFVFQYVEIVEATKDTFVYTMVAIVGMLIVCSLAAYEFNFYKFPGKKLLFSILMGSMMMPFVLYVIPLYRFVYNLGISDTAIGVALPLIVSPLSVFIMIQFLEDMPVALIESAEIDGANHFQIYYKIVLPLMRNGLIVSTILLFLRSWGSYLWPSLISGTNITPVSVMISGLVSPNFYADPRVKIAGMICAMLPPLIIYLAFQKHIIQGIAMSGLKG